MPPFFQRNLRTNFHFFKRIYKFSSTFPKPRLGSTTPVTIICPEHGEFLQKPTLHLCGNGCKECSGNVRLTTERFIRKAKELYGDKYDYSKAEYKGSNTKLCIICPEHGEFWQTPSGHMLGQGCPICAGRYMDTKLFIERSTEVHNGKYDYSLVDYKGATEKVKIICPRHGIFEQVASSHPWGNGCPICNQSHLENYVMRVLKSQKIKFETQKAFEWMTFRGKMHLDFFLPEQGIAIECQGEQHFVPSEFFGGEEVFIDNQARDKAKRDLCEAHGIKMLYFSDLGIEYPYPVIENPDTLLMEIWNTGEPDPTKWKDLELPFGL